MIKADVGRSNNFNMLRLVFASMVILAHTPEIFYGNKSKELLTQIFGTISFGGFAVDSFFLLSGYLIVKSWVRMPSLFNFLKNRILRIYPGFIVASLFCAFVVAPSAAPATYYSEFNIFIFIKGLVTLSPPLIPDSFSGTYYPITNGSMWTIRHEFVCYLLVAAVGVLGGFRYKYSWLFVTAIFVSMYFLNKFVTPEFFYHPTVRLGMLFTAGGAFFLYGRSRLNNNSLMIGAAALLLPCMFSPALVEFAMALCWGYIIISFAEKSIPGLSGFNRFPDVSYGVYLYAWPVTKLVLWNYPNINLLWLLLVTILISFFLGVASWYLVEKPFMVLKDRLPNYLWPMPNLYKKPPSL